MKQIKVQSKLGFFSLAFALVFGFAMMTATSAVAQNRNDRRNDDRNERRNDRTDRNRNDRRDDNDDYYNNDRRNDNNGRWDNRRDNNGRWDNDRYDQRRYITQQAYRAGMSQGIQDARDGRKYNANRAAGRAMGQVRVYNSRNQGEYKRIFREAFIQGYSEGYRRYDYRDNRWRNNRDRRNDY